jgi:hypothetical protein
MLASAFVESIDMAAAKIAGPLRVCGGEDASGFRFDGGGTASIVRSSLFMRSSFAVLFLMSRLFDPPD